MISANNFYKELWRIEKREIYFTSVSRTFHIWISVSNAIVCWYLPPHRGIDCELQDRPLGGSCYCMLTPSSPAGVTHGNSPINGLPPPGPLSWGGRPFKGPGHWWCDADLSVWWVGAPHCTGRRRSDGLGRLSFPSTELIPDSNQGKKMA